MKINEYFKHFYTYYKVDSNIQMLRAKYLVVVLER